MAETVQLDREQLVGMYRAMLRIRRFEELAARLVDEQRIPGVLHAYVGEEAVAVGVLSALTRTDVITSTHRGHGHILAKGADAARVLAELFGKESGYNRGRGGSMHVACFELGVLGANGIVGAGVPMAVGAAYGFGLRREPRVAVAFFGDGGINQGVVQESLNLAAIWRLPVVFVCENNGYAVSMAVHEATVRPIVERAEAYGMPAYAVDGMDVVAVYEAARQAVQRARAGDGPTFLECRTYRFVGHHSAERFQHLHYRSEAEISAWKARDPLLVCRRRLEAMGWTDAEEQRLAAEVEEELRQAVVFATDGRDPHPEEALADVYAAPYEGLPDKGVRVGA